MLVLHDDAAREHAYVPDKGLRDSKIGASPRPCTSRWTSRVGSPSAKNDWRLIFSFD
jgi:hypothetical protein